MNLSIVYRAVVALPARDDLHLTLPQDDLQRLQRLFHDTVTLPNGRHPAWWRPTLPETVGDALRSRSAPDSYVDLDGTWHAPHQEETEAYAAWSYLQLEEYSRTLRHFLSGYGDHEVVYLPMVVDEVEEHMQRWLEQFPAPQSRWLEQWLAWLGKLQHQPSIALLHCHYGQ